jgi:iron complex outermembrane receptor protein
MGELDQLFYRARDAIFYGGEASFSWDLFELWTGHLGVDGQFDFVRARFTRGPDRDVPRIPPIRWGGGIFYRGYSLIARVGFLRYEEQDRIGANETPTDDFTLLEAELSYRLDVFGSRAAVEFFVSGRNLTDARARNHVSITKDEVLMPGADVRFGLRGEF